MEKGLADTFAHLIENSCINVLFQLGDSHYWLEMINMLSVHLKVKYCLCVFQ